MKHASFFSGAGGLDLGFKRAGIETVSVSEIDPYANAILAERFPDAPNLGSITEVDANDIPEADIWSGGFPCQDLSVAGKRAGFAGKRSSLAFTFLDLVERRRPEWVVLENVSGLLTSNKGADFARLLHEMAELRYGVAWRVLDAKHFGVAQRRRRVYVVGSLGSRRSQQVLFECEGCERHPTPSREERHSVASATTQRVDGSRGLRKSGGDSETYDSDRMREANGLVGGVHNRSVISFPSRFSRHPTRFNNQADPLTISAGAPAVWYTESQDQAVADEGLLPLRLDSHRYRVLGNGVVAHVAQWIGGRLVQEHEAGGTK